jgi:DNA-binding transcriptional regulator PaaX
MSPDILDDVQARVAAVGAATESHLLTTLWRDFGINSDRARTALIALANTGRIERRVASNGQ